MQEHRAYFFTNMYISDIQRGIQTAHCISDMHMKYKYHSDVNIKIVDHWANHDKTMIVLNGGYSSHLMELVSIFSDQYDLPWEAFFESAEALGGALTCVGIIIPDYIYETAKLLRNMSESELNDITFGDIVYDGKSYKTTPLTIWLLENLSNYRLA